MNSFNGTRSRGSISISRSLAVRGQIRANARGELVFRLLLDKYAPHLKPGIDYRPTTDEELHRTAVYRIDIETWSGKQKEVAEDFPGAFSLEVPPVPFPKRATGSY